MEKGIRFGKYILVQRIARGGMAEIYLAYQIMSPPDVKRLVALKRILPEYCNDPSFVNMFLNEAKIASYLNHPNIAFVYEVGEIKGIYYIAMEYIAGVNLKQLIKYAFPIPTEMVLYIISSIAYGLSYAHKFKTEDGTPLNIVHRDITPHNIMVSFSGEVKLLDFGIAKARIQAERTRSGVLKGKYSYMSPEQATGRIIDYRSDIFSLGIVLYEALTGIKPFASNSPIETLQLVQECKPISPSLLSTRVTPTLERIILKCLAKDPNERYQDGELLAYELEELLYDINPSFTPAMVASFLKTQFQDRYKITQSFYKIEEKYQPYSNSFYGEDTLLDGEVKFETIKKGAFEDLADDIEEELPTKIWSGDSVSSILREKKKKINTIKKVIAITVAIGLIIGVLLGVGLWLLYYTLISR